MRFYGVVDDRLDEAVEFRERHEAVRVVEDWDDDEPADAGLLRVVAIEFETSAN